MHPPSRSGIPSRARLARSRTRPPRRIPTTHRSPSKPNGTNLAQSRKSSGSLPCRHVSFRNRQRQCRLNLRFLRHLTLVVLENHFQIPRVELAVHFVSESAMARMNQAYLAHQGPTDVLTFDHHQLCASFPTPALAPFHSNPTRITPRGSPPLRSLHGEIFICPAVARLQARQYRVPWQSEIVRYLLHGLLHLLGYDDTTPAARRAMKIRETGLLRKLERQVSFASVSTRPSRPWKSAPRD